MTDTETGTRCTVSDGEPEPAMGWVPDGAVADHLETVDRLLRDRLRQIRHDWWAIIGPGAALTDGHRRNLASIDPPARLAELVSGGGKRLRPTVSFLGFRAAGGVVGSPDHNNVVRIGAALELLHSFALIHDDVMDESTTRRGRPTQHLMFEADHAEHAAAGDPRRFGESMAILLGDLAHAEADQLIANGPVETRRHWHHMVLELIGGQFGDLAGAADRARDPAHALHIGRLKSGGYTIQRPLELGALAAGGKPDTMRRLSEYGREIGAAFALRDDILGVWGDPEITGKPAGDDLVSGKPTVIIALAYEWLPATHHRLLDRVGTTDLRPDEVTALQQLIRECGVHAEVEKMITRHVERGLTQLHGEPIDPGDPTALWPINRSVADPPLADPPRAELVRLARHIAWRDR